MAQGMGGFSFIDANGERSNMKFWTGVITAANLPGVLTQFGALRTAIDGIVLCNITDEYLKVFQTKLGSTRPNDAQAQREIKWLVTYTDITQYFDAPTNSIPNEGFGKIFNVELPGADLSLLPVKPGGGFEEELDISTGAGLTFKNAFEALAKSPHGGTPQILSVRVVGRNL